MRGTRVVHGAEVQGDMHGHTGRTVTFISADADRLQVYCWCQREVVWVAQFDLRHLGITYSCGRPACRGPLGMDEIGERAVGAGIGQKPRPLRSRGHVVRLVRPTRERCSPFEAALRRDYVEELWRQNKSVREIALTLGVADYTVEDDLLYIRTKRRAG